MISGMENYDHTKTEKKWQKKWLEEKVYEPDLDGALRQAQGRRKPFYNLMMFPYPSAEGLHVGNMYAFTGADIYGRMKRMQGNDVFEPIGLDGFGIHSENYALKIGAHPADQAKTSEKRFYEQLQSIGNGFAWDERLETYDPEYYRWTQWIFVQMWKNGLAYRKKQSVNWCPKDLTVLSDEQVIAGKCERCSAEVEKKELEQWFFKITDYAERLLKNLDGLDWSEKVKIAQRNWIGKSEGAFIKFQVSGVKCQEIEVFTTRPDTLFGATYLVLAPEHPWLEQEIRNSKSEILNKLEVRKYIEEAKHKTELQRQEEVQSKTGIELMGIKAVNPANKEEIPVWVADYALGSYGTGAIMAVPAHDERDFEFAKKFKLPIRQVIEPLYVQTTEPGVYREGEPIVVRNAIMAIVKHWSEDKYIGLQWKKVNWRTLLTGGIEKGQTAEQAGVAEIREETGFLHPKFVRELGVTHGLFYHVPKKENRLAHLHITYFELEDGACEAISEAENANHEIKWLTLDELESFLGPATHTYALGLFRKKIVTYAGSGVLVNSGKFSGLDSEKTKWEITKAVGGERKTQFRLRDWLISRQRYWGPPIPIIYCRKCWEASSVKRQVSGLRYGIDYATFEGEEYIIHAIPEEDLPVELPHIKNFRPTGSGTSPLAAEKSFHETKCPSCGGAARRETDVSDTFLDSAWYYLRYLDTANEKMAINAKRAERWLPVNMYTGGAEHAVLHLLYVRFVAMALHDRGLVKFEEPFKKFRAHGLLIKDGAKMSKSKGNVINPDEYIKNFGADVLRMYLMFLAPFEEGGDFRDAGILGVERFLKRAWKLYGEKGRTGKDAEDSKEFLTLLHKTIKKVTEDIENLHYNTAVSALMILLNETEKSRQLSGATCQIFAKLLAPFAPHMAEEIWREVLGHKTSIHREPWPEYDPKLLVEEKFILVLQVNGKVRDTVEIDSGITEQQAKELALENEKVKSFLAGKAAKKLIYVPKKLVNIVI
ncbi:MAG: hypothetical protein A2945_01670 [Candidatus Liptonbacteria bacterium RIFCSPLOWO2_01_FULL_52_25]|uniref:Leucine--tRNA ligase n=1 Tax=Candidatus Liptonbacteria bacterium RIFCSPLOWO2_01_FULL_52_25 TaxID=1798650 RepID=A0A1G2CFY2_9BACT|nr:MAG: hypothetical protein A2945_01670 [Candidatus Liptonbacteria bacterium RIFCSPLOWO2_01_FULL_52_25]